MIIITKIIILGIFSLSCFITKKVINNNRDKKSDFEIFLIDYEESLKKKTNN